MGQGGRTYALSFNPSRTDKHWRSQTIVYDLYDIALNQFSDWKILRITINCNHKNYTIFFQMSYEILNQKKVINESWTLTANLHNNLLDVLWGKKHLQKYFLESDTSATSNNQSTIK